MAVAHSVLSFLSIFTNGLAGVQSSSTTIGTVLVILSLPLLFRHFSIKRRSNIRFLALHVEDGEIIPPPASLKIAIDLAEDALHALPVALDLYSLIDIIFSTLRKALTPHYPLPSHVLKWRSWLLSERINIVFSPYLNQTRWGWVAKADESKGKPDFTLRILLDLAELTERTRDDHHLTADHFRFCFVITVLHEVTHILTKFAFPHTVTPKVPRTILQSGEAGEGFEHQMLGGKLVCEWESGHVADFKHLRQLYIRGLDDGKDYPLDDADIRSFLEKLQNPTPTTVFTIDLAKKEPSDAPADRVRTVAEAGNYVVTVSQSKGQAVLDDVGSPERTTIRTGPMLGLGKCYKRPTES
ncbi:hypothetical protein C8R44DRAFT_7307 [Mycena epipterygia]|nr:hypothetical protein C8R44DRAFT_7307 [Mycena epipterygia]